MVAIARTLPLFVCPLLSAQMSWRELAPSVAPYSRIVFDSAGHRFVGVFSPPPATGGSVRTFEWDGEAWQSRPLADPLPYRRGYGMAYDEARGRVVLFGGAVPGGAMNEIDEYDGAQWTRRTFVGVAAPTPRSDMAFAWLPTIQRCVMFGDIAGANDTWSWDGVNWQILTPGPVGLPLPAMAFHGPSARLVMFGLDQTWTFDGTQWLQQQPATVPPARNGQTMCTDSAAGVVRMFGGADTQLWTWNGTDWTATLPFGERRQFAGIACDLAGNLLVHGGERMPLPSVRPRGDTWRFSSGTWEQLDAGGPPPDGDTLLVNDWVRNRTIAMSNVVNFVEPMQLREWDGAHWWLGTAAEPPRRNAAAACFDPLRQRVVRFGGVDVAQSSRFATDDHVEWDGTAWTTYLGPRPTARSGHAMAADFARGVVVLFGGLQLSATSIVTLGDTWEWNGVAWHLSSITGPSPRLDHRLAYDPVHLQTVLYGGNAIDGLGKQDTWTWNGAGWRRELPTTTPALRNGFDLQYDFARQRVRFSGGRLPNGAFAPSDEWEWDGADWTQRPTSTPTQRGEPFRTVATTAGALQVNGNAVFVGSPALAVATMIGAGCGSTAALILQPFGMPKPGRSTFALDMLRGPAQQPALLAVSSGFASTSLGGDCTVYVAGRDIERATLLDAGGRATFALPVPASLALLGLGGVAQCAALDPGAPLGFRLSNGVSLRIGY